MAKRRFRAAPPLPPAPHGERARVLDVFHAFALLQQHALPQDDDEQDVVDAVCHELIMQATLADLPPAEAPAGMPGPSRQRNAAPCPQEAAAAPAGRAGVPAGPPWWAASTHPGASRPPPSFPAARAAGLNLAPLAQVPARPRAVATAQAQARTGTHTIPPPTGETSNGNE